MAKSKGILLDPNALDLQLTVERGSLGLISGGITIGNTLYQNQAFILQAFKGEYKEFPTLGVGLSDMLNDDDLTGWKREITLQLESDSMKVDKVDITTDKLIINAEYY